MKAKPQSIDLLKSLLASGDFHHATYRCHGSLWDGLWIYRRSATGFRGYEPAGFFFGPKHPDYAEAERLISGTGVSVGAYGQG